MENTIKSMTGYGVAKCTTSSSHLEVNLRSVNGRFLETRIHLPRELIGLESEIKKMLGRFFNRGTVDVIVSRKSRSEKNTGKLFLHEDMAQAWLQAASQIKKIGSFKKDLSLAAVLQLPQVVSFEEEMQGVDEDGQEVLRLVDLASQACREERLREGQALQTELLGILDRLTETARSLEDIKIDINEQLKEKLDTRLKARWPDIAVDVQRFQQELALLWDKADITEEITRLTEHLKHYRQLLLSTKVQGKKLDFYTQELLREMNTIGSKSPSVSLTQLVVTAKTDIEKLREQVQNIE